MTRTTTRLAIAAALASGMVVGVVAPALADVTVTVDVSKDKTIIVNELITIRKTVTITATIDIDLAGAAEAQALANIRNERNNVTYNDESNDPNPEDIDFSAVIDTSILRNSGIVGVNQDAGYNAKQGNVVAVAFTDSGNAFANSQAEADQINRGHTVLEGPANPPFPFVDPTNNPPGTVVYQALITNAVNGLVGAGIVGVNQNAGNNNSQLNMVAVAAAVDTAGTDVTAALSEAALGQENTRGSVTESGTNKTARITTALNTNTGGIIGVNQAAGNNANQANLVSLAAAVTP